MSSDVTAVIPAEKVRRWGLTQTLSAVAVVLGAAALAVSLLHAGPHGARGLQGARGVAGPQGPAGTAASTAYIKQLKECVPELTQWIQAFNVQTTSNSGSGAYWLTGAYLDTSQQQVTSACKKLLGLKS